MEYQTALDRALNVLPERNVEQERLTVPDPSGETDGAFTRLTNLGEIADALSRTPAHLHSAIQRTLGTSGQLEGDRARYSGSFSINDFEEAIDGYVEEYVICSECGLPDTRLVTEDGVDMLRCEACGAFRPVQKRSSVSNKRQREAVEEGRTYEVEITGTGRKGDGVAQRGKYTIFVPGAQEGQTVRIYIKNTSGSLAFARLA
ncbi:translation initiation factor IF-2 subunit beta [Haloferax volcanii]|uniref:Translation initiation factor IF-2 subunit beta n=3 Tax=Haloferax volcanii TaxID=2246 RepID=A0A384L4X4_HALVD|nr:translation initiation factor IF-2 subunit beta [Haloferax volcanii]ADE05141.1 translation initiation factor aIF-2 beta subunit / probable RNA-binding protein [Haloferax volcanii DS2]ELY33468.1 translation initiation factor IF-2 subunit beta [Haloferax volcanii DS2]MBS8119138.1 translation initiation factor IF-2 subunit beta [Haloferax volcanii]MBS8124151.1 translation initiation factor IF-2 subunit beta [Haloferax volcanii]MBS8128020.1 translation initiation factor IF-2 subunit beta [Halof